MMKPLRRLAAALRPISAEARELAYLNGSSSIIDLEFRQRQIDRGMFRGR